MNVTERIKQGPVCEYIQFLEEENDMYPGAGWALALFQNGNITKIASLSELHFPENSMQEEVDTLLSETRGWITENESDGEIWMGMCSCYTFCELFKITTENPASYARIARIVGDMMAEEWA